MSRTNQMKLNMSQFPRHQLLIESIIYSSLGSLRRVKGASSGEEGNVTTTTKVDFFPR